MDSVQTHSFNSQHLLRAYYVLGPVLGLRAGTKVSALEEYDRCFHGGKY